MRDGKLKYELAENMPNEVVLRNDVIVSVLTHEQFNSIKYVLGGKEK